MPDNTTPLHQQSCQPCEKGGDPMAPADAEARLAELDSDWKLIDDGKTLARTLKFDDYPATIRFVNALADLAEEQQHHPDLHVGYGKCQVTWSTHTVGGLSANDFICAAKTDQITQE